MVISKTSLDERGPACCLVLPTYFWFIQETDDDAKWPEVSNHVLWITFHVLLFEDVNQSLK